MIWELINSLKEKAWYTKTMLNLVTALYIP